MAAFETLVSRYQTRLLSFCRHLLGSREDAEDVLQEVLAAAFDAILADEREIHVRPWLYRIARNRSLNHLRRIQPVGVDSMDIHLSDNGASTADKVHDREEFRMLLGDIQDLPETQRTALVLREMDSLSYEQIADAMETTVPSVKSLLVRARLSLAEAAEARLLSCDDVRVELAEMAEGLRRRPTPLVRRHLRSCQRCSSFRGQLKHTNRALAALLPLGPLALLRKLAFAHVATHSGSGSGAASGGASGAGASGASATGAGATGAGASGAATASTGAALGSGGGGLVTVGAGAVASKAAAGLVTAALVTAGAVSATHIIHRHSGSTARSHAHHTVALSLPPIAPAKARTAGHAKSTAKGAHHASVAAKSTAVVAIHKRAHKAVSDTHAPTVTPTHPAGTGSSSGAGHREHSHAGGQGQTVSPSQPVTTPVSNPSDGPPGPPAGGGNSPTDQPGVSAPPDSTGSSAPVDQGNAMAPPDPGFAPPTGASDSPSDSPVSTDSATS